jgi:hypothetical protein
MGPVTISVVQTITYTNFGTSTTITHDAVAITVGCTIASIPNPTPPDSNTHGLTYTLYDSQLSIDLTNIPFTQSPPCDYAATNSYVWTNPEPTVIFMSPFDQRLLSVFTIDKSKLGSHTVKLVNTVTYGGGSWTPEYSFDITIVDPCDSTVLQTQAIATLSTDNGVPASIDFDEVKDSQEVTRGLSALCGPRAYEIKYTNDDPITWVTVAEKVGAADTWTISADPTLDAHATIHNLKLIVTLTLYPSNGGLSIPFNVNIATPACECNRVGWDPPADQTLTTTVKKIPSDTLTISHGSINAASLLATPQIRSCQGTCSTKTSIASIVDASTDTLPAFITMDANGVITVSSTTNADVRVYNMKVTMNTPDSGQQVYTTVKVDLQVCVITHLDPPTSPAATSYLIFAVSDLSIDLSSPGFQ